MKKRYTSCSLCALRFKRWSRKKYAAFISRQRAVTMGTLRCNIIERLQHKNSRVLNNSVLLLPEEKESDPVPSPWEGNEGITLLLQMKSVLTARVDAIPASIFPFRFTRKYKRKVSVKSRSFPLFPFLPDKLTINS